MTSLPNRPNPGDMKLQARLLRQRESERGHPITHSQALERVAKTHGFKDWNTASAAVFISSGLDNSDQDQLELGTPSQANFDLPALEGQRVSGQYLSQSFTGSVLRCVETSAPGLFRINIKFDAPIDVVSFKSFSHFRHRISMQIAPDGRSPGRTSDGVPHLVLNQQS